jgi:hypothetical protein
MSRIELRKFAIEIIRLDLCAAQGGEFSSTANFARLAGDHYDQTVWPNLDPSHL